MERRYAILTTGNTHPTLAKMASVLLRYRPDSVVALIDPDNSGRDASELLTVGKGVPITASLQDALALNPNALVIGINPAGGALPDEWRSVILEAIDAGLDIYSGMHSYLCDDSEISAKAQHNNITLYDLRKPPEGLSVNRCRAADIKAFRVHTVGMDCNCGKKVTTYELHLGLLKRGLDSEFIATGQGGILLSGKGIAIDSVPGDFMAGAAEQLVLENQDHEFLLLEGQGAIANPLYSGVTLSLLHGFMPDVLVLCHQPERTIMRGSANTKIPPINIIREIYEKMTAPVYSAPVVAISLNLYYFSEREARDIVLQTEFETGLPVTDVIRFGSEKILDVILNIKKEQEK